MRPRKPVSTYSGGMRRRLDLAMTLVGEPRVIFLDEPTTGLDPRSRRGMWQIIRDLVAGGVTIFLTTQYLEEADQLADRVAFLDHGRLIAEGTPAELKRLMSGGHVELQFTDPSGLDAAARTLRRTSTRDDAALTLQVPSDGGVRSLRALLDQLDGASIDVAGLTVHTPRPRRRLPHPHRATGPRKDRAMTTLTYAVRDSSTMLRRNLLHMRRYPSMTFMLVGMPGDVPAALRVRLRRHPRRGLGPAGGRAHVRQLRHPGHPADDGRRRGCRAPRSRSRWT